MNRLTTFEEVQDVVHEKAKDQYDLFVPVEQLEFSDLNEMYIGQQKHALKPSAQKLIANRLGIPLSYLEKCESGLQSENLNYWLGQERNDKLLFRFDGHQVRAIFTPRYVPVDHTDVVSQLKDYGIKDDTKVEFQMDDDLMMLNIPDEKNRFQLPGRDLFHPGFSIGNSEVGMSSLQISVYVMRLICTNGLISSVAEGSNYRHVSSRILEEFPQILNRTSSEISKQKRRWEISQESVVDDPEATIRTFNSQFQLSEPEREAVTWGYNQEPGNRMFDVINSYTKASQFPQLNTESSYRLQKVGGNILSMLN
jgi:hypothetical protein